MWTVARCSPLEWLILRLSPQVQRRYKYILGSCRVAYSSWWRLHGRSWKEVIQLRGVDSITLLENASSACLGPVCISMQSAASRSAAALQHSVSSSVMARPWIKSLIFAVPSANARRICPTAMGLGRFRGVRFISRETDGRFPTSLSGGYLLLLS